MAQHIDIQVHNGDNEIERGQQDEQCDLLAFRFAASLSFSLVVASSLQSCQCAFVYISCPPHQWEAKFFPPFLSFFPVLGVCENVYVRG